MSKSGEYLSPYLTAGTTRKMLFSSKRKRIGTDLDGVSKAYTNRKIDKNYKAKIKISLKPNPNEWRQV